MPPSPTILVTRPEAAARRFGAALRAAGCTAPVLIAPVMAINPVEGAMAAVARPMAQAFGVILTSVNAVDALAAQSRLRPPAWCVGWVTAETARAEGFDIRAAAGDADDLFRVMVGAGTAGPFIHPRGRHARGALAQRLSAAGMPTTEVVVYDQIARPLGPEAEALLQGSAPVILPLFSPRSARLLAEAAQAAGATAPLHLVAISDAAAHAWGEVRDTAPVALRLAERPDADAMLAATLAAIAAASGA